MIDIQHGALRAFEDNRLSLRKSAVQQKSRVANKRRKLFGGIGIFAKHFIRIQRIGIKQRMRDHVLFAARVFDVRAQKYAVEQVSNAQTAAPHFVFIRWTDAARRGSDFHSTGSVFRSKLHHAMVRQNNLRPVRDEKIAIDFHTRGAERRDLLKKGQRIDYDSIADDARALRPQNAPGHKLQNKFFSIDDDRVPGIVATGIASHHRSCPCPRRPIALRQ